MEGAGQPWVLPLHYLEAWGPDAFASAFGAMGRVDADGLLVFIDPRLFEQHHHDNRLKRPRPEEVEAGLHLELRAIEELIKYPICARVRSCAPESAQLPVLDTARTNIRMVATIGFSCITSFL